MDEDMLEPGNIGGLAGDMDLDSPLPTHDHLKGHSGAVGARQLGDAQLPQGRAGISKLEARGHVSLALCTQLPSVHESLAVQSAFAALPTCIPDWSRPGPSCIPGLEEAQGPGLFVLPKSRLRSMTS